MKKTKLALLSAIILLGFSCSKINVKNADPSSQQRAVTPAASPAGDVVGKVTVGYQGWFAAPGDGSPINVWWHWSQNWSQAPSPTNQAIKCWPDMREYTTTFQTAFANFGNGQPPTLFSSYPHQTVNTHFSCIPTTRIYSPASHRFNPNSSK